MRRLILWITAPLVAIYLGHWLTDLRRQRAKLPRLIEEVKALGCPTTVVEFEALTAVSPDRNAVEIYRDLITKIEELKERAPNSHQLIERLSMRTRSLPGNYREAHRDASALLHQLEEATSFRYLNVARFSDLSIDSDLLGPTMRFLSKLIFLEVLLAIEDEDLERSQRSLATFRRLCDHSRFDASRLAWLIHISTCSRYLHVLITMLRDADSPEAINWMERLIADLPAPLPLRLHIEGDVGVSMATYTESRGKPLAELGYVSFASRFGFFSSERAWDAYLAGELEDQINTLENWPDESKWREIERLTRPSWIAGKWWIAPSMGIPSPTILRRQGIGKALGSYIARLHITRLGLAVKQHRVRTGKFPQTLDELDVIHPDLPSPLHYWPLGDSFVLRCGMIEF